MSYLSFKRANVQPHGHHGKAGTLRSAFSRWLLENHGDAYRQTLAQQRGRAPGLRLKASAAEPMVGIAGGGFAGLFAGLILQSLGIGCEVFEGSDRVGGRIRTWYSTDYSPDDPETAGLYGELGGMRLPQFSADMLPVQQLALAVNSVLERNGLDSHKVYWRKFFYDSPAQRLRYNDMPTYTTAAQPDAAALSFGQANGGDVPDVWMQPIGGGGDPPQLLIDQVLGKVNQPFIDAINASFDQGFAALMQYDQYSMWDYLTTVFTLGDMAEFYDPAMGAKSDLLPWSVASYLETSNVGTGMYAVSFVEMVIAVYDWGGSKDPYRPHDPNIYMLTVDQGMQRFPDACHMVLDLAQGVTDVEGQLAQLQIGMSPGPDGFRYDPPNLCDDARPPTATANRAREDQRHADQRHPGPKHQRVFLNHQVEQMRHEPALYDGHGGMRLSIRNRVTGEAIEKRYPYVITTLPNGAYLNGQEGGDLLEGLSFTKRQALRQCEFMPAFKAFLTFKEQFWKAPTVAADAGLGAAATDRANRQIIYPSYGYGARQGVLQVYCWAQDAQRLGALSHAESINECLKGIGFLYPEVNVRELFVGDHEGRTTMSWFWDSKAGGGAFALFNPGQFKYIYPALLTPEFDGCLNFAGECCSVHHGWIVGALDSAYNAVLNVLQHAGMPEKIASMQKIWGSYLAPDIALDSATANVLEYSYLYNEADRKSASVAPGESASIYGDLDYVFTGNVPAMIDDFSKVPQSMRGSATDQQVLTMLNRLWDDNVALRAQAQARDKEARYLRDAPGSAVDLLERIYYGNNFAAIPAPRFWLKDDDEFARQQLAGFMPTLLTRVTPAQVRALIERAGIADASGLGALEQVHYVADYRQYLEACTVTPTAAYLPKPIVFFGVTPDRELMPLGLQLEPGGELFWPGMPNAANAWLLAKMLTNCAGQTLHDVGFHQLLTHQICTMVSIALFSEEVFAPREGEPGPAFQEHPVFKLLRPHTVKAAQFQQEVYNRDYQPYQRPFPATRTPNGKPGVYNLGFVYDLIFSCGRIGNYQLQDKIYNNDGKFRFLDHAIPVDADRRGVLETPFSYAYVHDALAWYRAMAGFVGEFVDTVYPDDAGVRLDAQLQHFFDKLIPAFNYVDGKQQAARFPGQVVTKEGLKSVLAMFVWQFSVQHTVVNDGAYNHAAFVPNASTLMYAPPAGKPSREWTPADVLACLPDAQTLYPSLGNMNFMDVQINASVVGQGPYPETVLGRGVIEPPIDILQDTYAFSDPALRAVVDHFYQSVREVDQAIKRRQAADIARYTQLHPGADSVPPTVLFDLITPTNVMNTIQT
jgi:monoamine oxidase